MEGQEVQIHDNLDANVNESVDYGKENQNNSLKIISHFDHNKMDSVSQRNSYLDERIKRSSEKKREKY